MSAVFTRRMEARHICSEFQRVSPTGINAQCFSYTLFMQLRARFSHFDDDAFSTFTTLIAALHVSEKKSRFNSEHTNRLTYTTYNEGESSTFLLRRNRHTWWAMQCMKIIDVCRSDMMRRARPHCPASSVQTDSTGAHIVSSTSAIASSISCAMAIPWCTSPPGTVWNGAVVPFRCKTMPVK